MLNNIFSNTKLKPHNNGFSRKKIFVNKSKLESQENTDMEVLEFIQETAISAGKLILKLWGQPLKTSQKEGWDIVTNADLLSQSLITNSILHRFPNHGFLTEEDDPTLPQNGDAIWIIDPIDGTINYSRNHRLFAVSIALVIENEIRIGVIYDPVNHEMFSAVKGKGFFVNGTKYTANNLISHLSKSMVGFDWNQTQYLREEVSRTLFHLSTTVQTVSVLGSATLALAWIACGRMDGYFNYSLQSWDIAAGYLMIKEAGGDVSHFSGEEWNWKGSDKTIVASNEYIHTILLQQIHQK